jgi:hypothetical protein
MDFDVGAPTSKSPFAISDLLTLCSQRWIGRQGPRDEFSFCYALLLIEEITRSPQGSILRGKR